jgi:hypothetical protein
MREKIPEGNARVYCKKAQKPAETSPSTHN